MILKIFLVFFALIFALLLPPSSSASGNQFVTIVNPVRGNDFFSLPNTSPTENVKKQYEVISKNNLSATWLLRPDSLENSDLVSLAKTFSQNQELGLFMEITPTWTRQAGVNYHNGANWHTAGSVFLTGYSVPERRQLIDNAFAKFKSLFGYYPKSVGAWWIDAGSLTYMKDKYEIVANMDVADQYSTDNYSVWGQYFSTPFYPSKRNALVPASGPERKIGVVTIQWATRDPYNSYGNGVLDSTYSVQANDYANPKYHNLDINYFKQLASIYLDNPNASFGQVTVGLENDFKWQDYGSEFQRQIELVAKRKLIGTKVLTMSQFGDNYKLLFPTTSPIQTILADDPLGSGGQVLWYQNLKYRVGWFKTSKGSMLKDLRLYRDSQDEPCLEKSCESLDLAMMETHSIDEVTYNNSWFIDEGKISDVKLQAIQDGWRISYKNPLGNARTIDFLPDDIKVDGFNRPIPVVINEATDLSNNLPKIDAKGLYQLQDGLQKTLFDQIKYLAIFLGFVIIMFYLPGLALLNKLDLEGKFSLSIVIGMVIFTLTSFLLLYLKQWWLIFTVILLGGIALRNFKSVIPKPVISKQTITTGLIIFAGSLSWLLTTVKNGLIYDYGMGFWGAHGHDSLWHLSLIESLKKGSLDNPIFSGEALHNYHFFYDLLLAQTSRISGISAIDLYFRMFPILIALLCGVITYRLAKSWFRTELAANLAVFFLYFGGSFGWIVSWFKNRSLGGETLFWAQQGISTFVNPPFAISSLLFLAGLVLFQKIVYQKQQHVSLSVALILIWGSLIEFKAYAGILVLGGLGIVTLFELINKRFRILTLTPPILLLSLLVFLPNNSSGGSLLVFSPFWLIHSMVDFPDRLSWSRLSLTRISGFETGNYFKIFGSELIGLIIFIVGNLGSRVIGFTYLRKVPLTGNFNIFIIAFLAGAFIIPLLFIQKGANFNIIQFFYYFLLVFNFLVAASIAALFSKMKILGWFLVSLIVLVTVPTTWDSLHHFVPARPPARISSAELKALNFLKMQPDGIVLNYAYDKKLKERFNVPLPIFSYESTAYVGALSSKPEFIADTVNLEILDIDYKSRLQAQKEILSMREPSVVNTILKDNSIAYVYTPKIYQFNIASDQVNLKKIYENDEVLIYKTQ